MAAAISRETASMKLKSTEPSGRAGVGTAMKMTSDRSTPSRVLLVKCEASGGGVLAHQFFQARLVNGHAARLEQRDFLGILVHADDLVAGFGKTGAGDQADVTGSDESQLHTAKWLEGGGDGVKGDCRRGWRPEAGCPSAGWRARPGCCWRRCRCRYGGGRGRGILG